MQLVDCLVDSTVDYLVAPSDVLTVGHLAALKVELTVGQSELKLAVSALKLVDLTAANLVDRSAALTVDHSDERKVDALAAKLDLKLDIDLVQELELRLG